MRSAGNPPMSPVLDTPAAKVWSLGVLPQEISWKFDLKMAPDTFLAISPLIIVRF